VSLRPVSLPSFWSFSRFFAGVHGQNGFIIFYAAGVHYISVEESSESRHLEQTFALTF
jgi:hypothetical protein